jgi:hypothetical protein
MSVGKINEFVDDKGFAQLDDLLKKLGITRQALVDATAEATKFNNAISGSKSIPEFIENQGKAATAIDKVSKAKENERLAEIRLQQAREKAFDDYEKKLAKQTAETAKASSAYLKLQQAYEAVNREAKNAAVQFGLTSYQFKEASAQALGLRKRLDEIDQPLGNYGRNVGNYQNKFNGLGNSISQLTREMPAFTNSIQTGFMALSNNLPIFFDQIKQTQLEIKAMRAEGQKVPGLFSQIASSIFSWGTALSIGVTLLTVYGKEIGEFIKATFKGTEAINQFAERQRLLSEALKSTDYKTAVSNVIELKNEINLAKDGFINKDSVVKHYNETIGKTTGLVTNLKDAEDQLNKNANAYIQFTYLKAAANLALESASKKAFEIEQERLKTPEQSANFFDKVKSRLIDNYGASVEFDPDAEKNVKASIAKRGKQRNQAVISQGQKDLKDLEKIFANLNKQAAELAKTNNFDFFGGDDNDRKKKAAEDAKKAAAELKARLQKEKEAREASARELMDLQNDYEKQIEDAKKRGEKAEEERLKAILTNSKNVYLQKQSQELQDAQDSADMQLMILAGQYKQGLISKTIYEEQKNEIEKSLTKQSVAIQISALEEVLRLEKEFGADTASDELKLAELKLKLSKLVADQEIADAERAANKKKELKEREKQLIDELFNFTKAVGDGAFTNQLNRIQEEKNEIDAKSKSEIDAVNNSIASEQDKAAKISIINARATAEKQKLAQEERQIKTRQAEFDKALSIAAVIRNTAEAISKTLAEGGILFSPLVGVIAAIGAVQIATILATPIPKFEKGGTVQKDGPIITGEAGPELRIDPSGKYSLTAGHENVTYAKAGTKIINNKDLMKMVSKPESIQYLATSTTDNRKSEKLLAEIAENIKNQKRPIVNIQGDRWGDYSRQRNY